MGRFKEYISENILGHNDLKQPSKLKGKEGKKVKIKATGEIGIVTVDGVKTKDGKIHNVHPDGVIFI
jgi:hypothetical protein